MTPLPAPLSGPLVSIVLPTRNGEAFLRDAIGSCLNQTWDNLELVVVNDGSTNPATAAILESIGDKRLRVLTLADNVGLPRALNAGFAAVRGDLVSWTSDDNLYRPEAIATMVEGLRREHADFVYARATEIDETGRVLGTTMPRSPEYLPIDNCVGACFLYTRRVMETVGEYDPEMFLTEDYDYWVRVSKRFRMARVDADLYLYRRHGQTLTEKHGRARVEEMIERVRQTHFGRADILRAQGLAAFGRGDYREARRALGGALVRRPMRAALWRPFAIATLPAFAVRAVVGMKRLLKNTR